MYGAQPFWTGTKVILLGSSYCVPGEWSCPAPFPGGPSGWLNDPTTGQRTAMVPDAVAADIGPTTWTGQALVVVNDGGTIGGPNGATTLRPGDGAAYDPATNGWTTLPPSPILDLSGNAGTVWTGAEQFSSPPPRKETVTCRQKLSWRALHPLPRQPCRHRRPTSQGARRARQRSQ